MSTWTALTLLLLAQEPPVADAPSAHERMQEIAERYAAGDVALALSLTDGLLGEADGLALEERTRAELCFARGLFVAESAAGPERLAAVDAFQSARALAGPGELRLDATYDAGVVHLLEAERLRSTIPELAQAPGGAPGLPTAVPGAPGAPAVPGLPPPATGESAEDPLPAARAAYLAARELLVERLRAAWQDADTRANLELIQRRLRELDELERQRQEQEQQQEQQQQGQEGDEDQEKKEGEQGEGEQEPKEQQGEPQEGDKQQKEGEEPPPDPSEKPQEDPTETEPTQPPEAQQPSAAEPSGEEERHLTREEVMRLLDRLAEIDEKAQALRAALREARRIAVERDW